MWSDKPQVVVPVEILNICQSIQNKIPEKEFSILVKPAEIKPYKVILSKDYVIPKQEVTTTSVDYDSEEMLKFINEGYIVVIHSHHNLGCGFSETDKTQLHQGDILASILFAQNTFKQAVILVKSNYFGIAEIEASVEIQYPNVDISNIKIKKPKYVTVAKAKTTRKDIEEIDIMRYIRDEDDIEDDVEICYFCGALVSTRDHVCPNCGRPLNFNF